MENEKKQGNSNTVSEEIPKNEPFDYSSKIKLLNNVQFYTKNSYVDIYDTTDSSWKVAKILDLNQNYMKISFDGWKSVFDEVKSFNYFF